MDRKTGKRISPDAHRRQLLEDVLTTPVATRLMRRDYGVPIDLIDRNISQQDLLPAIADIIQAIETYLPFFVVREARPSTPRPGVSVFDLRLEDTRTGEILTFGELGR